MTAGSSVLEDPSTVVDAVNSIAALSEPTLSSLGLGLASWWPSGMVQAGLESIHVGLDVPWWTAIVIGNSVLYLVICPPH
jgi:YidC/Oxa1 family membrane protein insertase